MAIPADQNNPLKQKLAAFIRQTALWLIIGFLAPWIVIFFYLGINGALPQFLDILFNTCPCSRAWITTIG